MVLASLEEFFEVLDGVLLQNECHRLGRAAIGLMVYHILICPPNL